MADQLAIVAHILETNPFYLRSKQIRQVDKALGILENYLNPEFIKEAKFWKDSHEGLQVLKKKLESIDQTQLKIVSLEKEIDELKILTRPWYALEDTIRDLIIQQNKRAVEFLKNQGDITEASVIERYHRSIELQDLFVYADRAPHLCDAILHYTQKERYQQNLLKLRDRIDAANKQIKTIRRGFWMALVLCLFIATVPICLPFAITLWQRKQRLYNHLMIYEDLKNREQKRSELAEEGYSITHEIRAIVGDVSYEAIRNLLMEAKDLKSEFHDSNRFLSVCAVILNFIDGHKKILIPLFGNMPEHPKDRFLWLIKNVQKFENAHKKLESFEHLRRELYLRKKQITKGYERETLTSSITQLKISMDSVMKVSLDISNKIIFNDFSLKAPESFKKIRETIFYVSQNYDVDLTTWNNLHIQIQDYARQLAIFVLDAEILEQKNNPSNENSDTITNTVLAPNLNEEVII